MCCAVTGHTAPVPKGMPLVVKLGGSLYPQAGNLMPVLRSSVRPLLVVPGGGPFARAVRQAGLNDEAAHGEAIAAMDAYGRYCASFNMPVTETLAAPAQTVILLPSRVMREHDPLPHSWDVTSDTIAAWVAATLHLDLLLLKSVDGIMAGGVIQREVRAPRDTDTVDPFFIPYVLEHRVDTFVLNGLHPTLITRFLRGGQVPGTRISTTF
jgi:5-(aminomethyl)-3-furanmethanol phosphate kinase